MKPLFAMVQLREKPVIMPVHRFVGKTWARTPVYHGFIYYFLNLAANLTAYAIR